MSETIVSLFSEFQISFLRGLFYNESAPEPHNTKVSKIARTSDGAMIVEWLTYGQFTTTRIDYKETAESYLEKRIKETPLTFFNKT